MDAIKKNKNTDLQSISSQFEDVFTLHFDNPLVDRQGIKINTVQKLLCMWRELSLSKQRIFSVIAYSR